MLYEVALLQSPTKKEQEEDTQEVLILGPIPVVAKDEQSAGVAAVIQNKDKIECDIARVQVLVRPLYFGANVPKMTCYNASSLNL